MRIFIGRIIIRHVIVLETASTVWRCLWERQIVSCEKKIKKIQNGDLRSDHISHQQKWIHTDLGLHAANLNSNTTAFIA
jgi:hypothetical protein